MRAIRRPRQRLKRPVRLSLTLPDPLIGRGVVKLLQARSDPFASLLCIAVASKVAFESRWGLKIEANLGRKGLKNPCLYGSDVAQQESLFLQYPPYKMLVFACVMGNEIRHKTFLKLLQEQYDIDTAITSKTPSKTSARQLQILAKWAKSNCRDRP